LQPKSEKCIFVGYSEDVKGYRLLQSHCNEIIIRRDVKFDENPSCTKICKKKSTWNNLLAMFRMTLALFVASRNLFIVSSKLPELGMPKWIAFLLPLDSLDAILILMSIPRN
jgi:hypothetical protein